MVPGDIGNVPTIGVPSRLHGEIGTIGQFAGKLGAVGIHDCQAIDMFVAMYISDPAPIGRQRRRGMSAKFGRDRARFAAGQGLAVQAPVRSEKYFTVADGECAAAVTDAPGHIQLPIRQIAWRFGAGLRQQDAGLPSALQPYKRVTGAVPLHIAQADSAGD